LDAALSPPDAEAEALTPSSDLHPQIDSAFGVAGTVGGLLSEWTPVGVGVDTQDRILISGPSSDPSRPPANILRRLLPDGTLDLSFGVSGSVSVAVHANELAQVTQTISNGAIGVLGSAFNGSNQGFVSRVQSNGSADATFGTTPPVSIVDTALTSGLWQGDGSGFLVALAGIERFEADGAVDLGFGAAGTIAGAEAAAANVDGKLWTSQGGVLRRYLANGTLDSSFGQGGMKPLPWSSAGTTAQSVVLTASGVTVVGSHASDLATYLDVAWTDQAGSSNASGSAAPVPTNGAPIGASDLGDGRVLVWTSGADLVVVHRDGSLDGPKNAGQVGTLIAAAVDSGGHLVVTGITTEDPTNATWFVRRYGLF
jgi:hypothetical protein